MKRTIIRLSAIAIALGAAATPAMAQLAALPVYASPKGGTGFTLSGDFGRCMSNCGVDATGSDLNQTFIGARARIGFSALQFGVGAGIYNDDVTGTDSKVSFAVNTSFTLFGGPLLPVSVGITTGVGILKAGDVTSPSGEFSDIVVPIALGISLNIPTPGFGLEPWVAPRVQFTREGELTGPLGVISPSNSDIEFGVSGGISAGLPMGLGFHIAVDFLSDSADPRNVANGELGSLSQLTVGVGVQYTFSVPGLPIVPIL